MKIILVVIIFLFNSILIFASRTCPVISLRNGSIKYRSKGRIARFRCNRGFSLVGENYIACIKGQWDSEIPKCISRSRCSPITEIQNGHVLANKQWTSLLFYCNSGYHLSGPTKLYCKNSTWSGEVPKCQTNIQLSCDFEKPGICGWDNSTKSGYFWIRRQYATPSHYLDTGPGHDHTLHPKNNGHYLYIETSGLYGKNLKTTIARLYSPLFPPVENNGTCFTFWYHMFGSTIGELIIYIDGHKVFYRSGNQGNRWIRGIITNLPTDTFFQISIEGVPGNGWTGDIAIDDLNITTSSECSRPYLEETTCDGRCYEEEEQSSTLCKCNQKCLTSSTCCGDFFEACNAETTTGSPHFSEYKEETTLSYSEELTSNIYDITDTGLRDTKYVTEVQNIARITTKKQSTDIINSDLTFTKHFSDLSKNIFLTTDKNIKAEQNKFFSERDSKTEQTNFNIYPGSTETEINVYSNSTTRGLNNIDSDLATSTELFSSPKNEEPYSEYSTIEYTTEYFTSENSISSKRVNNSDLKLDYHNSVTKSETSNFEPLVKSDQFLINESTTLGTRYTSNNQFNLFANTNSILSRDNSSEIPQASDLSSGITLKTKYPHTHLHENKSFYLTTLQYELPLYNSDTNVTDQTITSHLTTNVPTDKIQSTSKNTYQLSNITQVNHPTTVPSFTDHLSFNRNRSLEIKNTTELIVTSRMSSPFTIDKNQSVENINATQPTLHAEKANYITVSYLTDSLSVDKKKNQSVYPERKPTASTEVTKQMSTSYLNGTESVDRNKLMESKNPKLLQIAEVTETSTLQFPTEFLTEKDHLLESKVTIPTLRSLEVTTQTTKLLITTKAASYLNGTLLVNKNGTLKNNKTSQPPHTTEAVDETSILHITSTNQNKITTHYQYNRTQHNRTEQFKQITYTTPVAVHIQLAQTERSKWKSAYQPKGYYTYSAMKQEHSGPGLKNISIILSVAAIFITIASVSVLYIIYRRRNYLNAPNDVEEADVLFIANDEMLDFSVGRPKKNARHDNLNKSLL